MKSAQKLIYSCLVTVLWTWLLAKPAFAACNFTFNVSSYTVSANCNIDSQTTETYDYAAQTGDPNSYQLIIPTGYSVTLTAGISGTPTTLGIGKLTLSGGSLVIAQSYAQSKFGEVATCWVTDSDSDNYSPAPNTCYTSGGAGRVRKYQLTATTTDCYDSNANAKPGQLNFFTTNRGDGSYDYDCDSDQQKQDPTTYTCSACTNGSGYASFQAVSGGWTTAGGAACGASENYYTVTNGTCRDPAVADCSSSVTVTTPTQACN